LYRVYREQCGVKILIVRDDLKATFFYYIHERIGKSPSSVVVKKLISEFLF